MDTHVDLERLICNVSSNGDDSSRRCANENGHLKSCFEDCGIVCDVGGSKGAAALCPVTPIPRRKTGELVSAVSSPLSGEAPQSPNVRTLDTSSICDVIVSSLDDSPRTPDEGVFNPFAPGPEDICLAPLREKVVKESRRIVARHLNFDEVDELRDDDKEAEMESEKVLLDIVYGILLEAIIVKQSEDFLAENQHLESTGCRTPTSLPHLNGIAETCPAAPSKATARKSLKIDQALCRKLEF